MSCCGKLRAALRSPGPLNNVSAAPSYRAVAQSDINFEYSGQNPITVTGPLTGAVYRFQGRGARLRVHGADAPSLLSVPGLRPVR